MLLGIYLQENSETNFVWGLHWSTKQLVFHSALVDQFLQQFSGRTNYLPAEGRQLSILPIFIISIIIRIFLIIIIIIMTMMEKIMAERGVQKSQKSGISPSHCVTGVSARNPGKRCYPNISILIIMEVSKKINF